MSVLAMCPGAWVQTRSTQAANLPTRRRGRTVLALASAGVVALLLGACQGSRPGPRAPLPPKPASMNVTMREYGFAYGHSVPPGRVVVRARNAGALPHQLVLVGVPQDTPPIEEQVVSPTARTLATLAVLPTRAPSRRGSFAVDLTPGRYAMICFVKDADGVTHARKGMAAEFRVAETTPAESTG